MNDVPSEWPEVAQTANLTPNKKALLAVVVLAFSQSKMREVVGKEALAMVLEGTIDEMTCKSGVLELEPLWSILTRQPGFQLADAVPPMLAIKGWEPHLGVYVELPLVFTDAKAMDVWQYSKALGIGTPDVLAALKGELQGVHQEKAETLVATPYAEHKKPVAPPAPKASREIDLAVRVPAWKVAAAGVAVLAVAALVWTGLVEEAPPDVPLDSAPEAMKDARAQAAGTGLLVTLKTDAWARQPVELQKEQLGALMEAAGQKEFASASVLMPDGNVVAIYVRAEIGEKVSILAAPAAPVEPPKETAAEPAAAARKPEPAQETGEGKQPSAKTPKEAAVTDVKASPAEATEKPSKRNKKRSH